MSDILLIAGFGFVVVLQLLLYWRLRLLAAASSLPSAEIVSLVQGQERLERELRAALAQARSEAGESARRDRESLAVQSSQLAETLSRQFGQLGQVQARQLENFSVQLQHLAQGNAQQADLLRTALNERLAAIQRDNAEKLEVMRRTVDERLHATLEQRLGESFRLVSERLERVHHGLGEMQSLASGVGDLKRVLTNVKTRGIWGEIQLAALLEQILTSEQYAVNIATRPNSAQRVEFAIRLPGQGDSPVWLPIDAKFPLEDYQRLLDAQDTADAAALETAAKALEKRLREEAKKIAGAYVEPPYTTDFAVLYLPVEGLYAEILRRPGLADSLQREYRITLAGPTTLTALLNSLQMGFRTLAIEQRSSEVWALLGAVRTEFGKFGMALAATRKKLDQAAESIGAAETRTRAIERKLRDVEALPEQEAQDRLGTEE